MKRFISILLVVALMISTVPSALAAEFAVKRSWSDDIFTDVPAESWFYQTVKTAYELELMSGYGDGTFSPEGNITLAETVTIAARIHAMATDAGQLVQEGIWYRVYVDYALKNGILTEELSDYNRAATRLEFARILAKALPAEDLVAINTVDDGMIPDVAEDEAVYLLYRAGILIGNDDLGTFSPNATIIRCEVAAIVARMALPALREEITLTSKIEQPETEQPETEQPETEQPETEQPETEQPETEQPETEQPETEQPETEQPETEPSENEGGESEVLDENNALTVPFDQAYPDLFATGEFAYSGEQILIKLENEPTGEQQAQLQAAGVVALEHIMDTINAKWYKAIVSGDVNEAIESVRALSFVLIAEYDYVFESDTIIECGPEDLDDAIKGNNHYADQWYLRAGGIKRGWDHMKKPHKRPHYDEERGECHEGEEDDEEITVEAADGIIIAVIDTGVDYNHEDLKDNIWINTGEIPDNGRDDDGNGYIDDYYGYNAVANRGSAMDDQGHGTHVAGIIAAANNNIGIVGIAYNATVMPIKAGMASGYFNSSDIAEAIIYAYQNGADVINMSFGGSASTILVQDALEAAYTRCILVAAAGNDGAPNEGMFALPAYPAALSYVIGVMSVDQNGVESSFTNYDVLGFNSIEYEVYAPGDQMISTIPGNRYATWSGTSMAAPVVSAIAALVRSEFRDVNTYPTKFVYGQICGTGNQNAACFDPQEHGQHNLPKIVDVYNALTVLPTPDVGVTDFRLFDTEGLNGSTVNNGDGVIDSGETIAIGFFLRNKWGKSTDTTITVDTLSQAGIADPYITIHNPSVTIGEVGTYSTNDCGKVMENDAFVGWELPLYITIDPDCPNDYIFKLNVTVTCKNGLDAEDTTVYSNEVSLNLDVRSGMILPNLVEEDMVLTKDNYYIIPNAMLIKEGATVIVEAGTQIQFWSDDPNDAYADTAITYLNVEGTLIFSGTAEEPIRLFPSERMDRYRVEINAKNSGVIKMFHTNVVNPYLTGITYAEGCEFSQNYRAEEIYFRNLSSGQVNSSSGYGRVDCDRAVNCAFYKLGGRYSYRAFCVSGEYDGCIFVDSSMDLTSDSPRFENCLFYGNNNYLGENSGYTSSLTLRYLSSAWNNTYNKIVTNAVTGTTYVRVSAAGLTQAKRFAELLGGHLAVLETAEELDYVDANFGYISGYAAYTLKLGLIRDLKDDSVRWVDGTLPGGFVNLPDVGNGTIGGYTANNDSFYWTDTGTGYYLIEIPARYVEEIALDRYAVKLDTAGYGWQIVATVAAPSSVADPVWVYESMDESVAVVSETGYITPVGEGETVIHVYASDRGVYNTVNVTVVGEVMLESISLGENFRLPLGESKQLRAVLTPANTSKQYLVYTTSDASIATVDAGGLVTVHAVGTATITVTNPETGISGTVVVEGYIPVTSVTTAEPLFATDLSSMETVEVLGVAVMPTNATYPNLIWESSNPEILDVDENGNLIKYQEGFATLRATAEGTDLYVDVIVALTDMDTAVTVVQLEQLSSTYTLALLSDGTLWCWGGSFLVPQQIEILDNEGEPVNICKFAAAPAYNYQLLILNDRGELNVYTAGNYNCNTLRWRLDNYSLGGETVSGVVDIAGSGGSSYDGSCYYLKDDGSVWCWGSNGSGQLGINNTTATYTAVDMIIDEINGTVVDIEAGSGHAVLLTDSGDAYYVGYPNALNTTYLPTFYSSGVVGLYKNGGSYIGIEYANSVAYKPNGTTTEKLGVLTRWYNGTSNRYYISEDGTLYARGNNDYGQLGNGTTTSSTNVYIPVAKVENVVNIFFGYNSDTLYIQTADGKFYGVGYNANAEIPNLTSGNQTIPVRIYFGLTVETDVPVLEGTNLTKTENDLVYTLHEDALVLEFDQALVVGTQFGSIKITDSTGTTLSATRSLYLDKFIISPRAGFVLGETYTVTIPARALITKFGVNNEEIIFTFPVGEGAVSDGGEDTGDTENTDNAGSSAEVVNTTQRTEAYDERIYWTQENVIGKWEELQTEGINPTFYHNAIINRINDDDVTRWLRVVGYEYSTHTTTPVGGNYWGTTNEFLINKQILDFDDYQSLLDLVETPYLTEAPADVWPFVVDAWLENKDGERVSVIGNEVVTFCVKFNRAMDTSIPLDVRFGSYYPYADYEVGGEWASETLWKGTTTLTTLIEAGYQCWSVNNGCAADNPALKLYKDWGRFPFEIDTSSALAMNLQGAAGDEGVTLTWTQDDFDTLMGYNVYRADQDEDGYYQRINTSIIPNGIDTFFDDTVEPGKVYYYIFTVVKTDFSESEPSGKIRILSKDTMAPILYHTPVYTAYEGNNVVISATANDNLELSWVKLFYRITGTENWNEVAMTKLNDKYSAVISGDKITLDGIEYYIVASDGINATTRGSVDEPYSITVQEALGVQMLGDVNGDGRITVTDALRVLRAINGKVILEKAEFDRADLDANGVLTAAEALMILKYANGEIGSLKMN